jgi:hypothetical protein
VPEAPLLEGRAGASVPEAPLLEGRAGASVPEAPLLEGRAGASVPEAARIEGRAGVSAPGRTVALEDVERAAAPERTIALEDAGRAAAPERTIALEDVERVAASERTLALEDAGRAAAPERAIALEDAGRAAASGWTLVLEDATVLAASCVIDATGRRASIATRQGAVRRRDDALIALYQWASGGVELEERTLVEAVPEGWWYTAPLPGDARVLAFHTDADIARRVRSAMPKLVAASKHVSARLAGLAFDARFRAAEACGARLDAFVGRGWVAVGDAALSFDPIAAQGIFNALYTGMKAGEAVDAALRGDPSGLSAYSRRLEEIRAAYVERRVHVYELETRYASSPFWQRR